VLDIDFMFFMMHVQLVDISCYLGMIVLLLQLLHFLPVLLFLVSPLLLALVVLMVILLIH